MAERIKVQYFSDVLCVWAYVAQIRLDELQRHRGDDIDTRHHFVSVFGSTEHRIGDGWSDRGGFDGYAAHAAEICERFPHVELNPSAWREVRPTSSAPAHQLLKALQLHERDSKAEASRFEEVAWAVRSAFFRDARDISEAETLWAVAAECGLPVDDLTTYFDDGRALAGVCRDAELMKELGIEGSPTYVLNDGRQKLYGNLGYKVIEANVDELLHQPTEGASWC